MLFSACFAQIKNSRSYSIRLGSSVLGGIQAGSTAATFSTALDWKLVAGFKRYKDKNVSSAINVHGFIIIRLTNTLSAIHPGGLRSSPGSPFHARGKREANSRSHTRHVGDRHRPSEHQ
jgi:hypothetical protein